MNYLLVLKVKAGTCGETRCNMGITEEGIQGEQFLMDKLKKIGFKVFQPDTIGFKKGRYYIFEFKHQERYRNPDGHGLPPYQVKARLDFEKVTGVIAMLVILDKETKETFVQALSVLEAGEHFLSKTGARVIYPIESFHRF